MRPKKTKKKKRYTMMLISNRTNDAVKQYHMSAKGFGIGISIVVVLLAVMIGVGVFSIRQLASGVGMSVNLESEMADLATKNSELTLQNEELNNKVTILSDTVNQKVEVEAAKAAEDAQKSEPSGFPLSGTATMTEANANEGAGEGAVAIPMIIFEAAAGTKVIASGNGTVSYAGLDDTDYGNMIKIDHGNGYISVYRNAAEAKVSEGDEITRGTLLFEMGEGSTKLGYEIMYKEQFINPLEILEIAG